MAATTIRRPTANEYSPYHGEYVSAVPDGDVLALLEGQMHETAGMLRAIGEERSRYRYAPGKWSIREVIGHVSDAERVFTYRALTFARGDATPLPGFDEIAWGAASNAHERPLSALVAELVAVRAASVALFSGFSAEQLDASGTASGHRVTVRGLLYVVVGHERHHVRILRERYLS